MLEIDRSRIRVVYDEFGAALPDPIREAEKTLGIVRDVRAAIENEQPPALDYRDAKHLAASITAAAEHHAAGEQRIELARSAERDAASTLDGAWHAAIPAFHRDMAGWFAETARQFLDDLARLDGDLDPLRNLRSGRGEDQTQVERRATQLSAMRQARSAIHGRLDATATPFWRWTQIVAVPDLPTAMQLDTQMRDHRLPGSDQPATAEGSPAWWARLAAIPGVELRYHNPQEQAEIYNQFCPPRKPPALVSR